MSRKKCSQGNNFEDLFAQIMLTKVIDGLKIEKIFFIKSLAQLFCYDMANERCFSHNKILFNVIAFRD